MKMSFRDFNEQFADPTNWKRIKRDRRLAGKCWQCCAPCRSGKCQECGANNKPIDERSARTAP